MDVATSGLSAAGAAVPPALDDQGSALAALIDCHGAAAFGLAVRLLPTVELAEAVVLEAFLSVQRPTPMGSVDDGRYHRRLLDAVCRSAGDLLGARVGVRSRLPEPGERLTDRPVAPAVVRDALTCLSPAARAIVDLSFYDGLDYRQAAPLSGTGGADAG